MCASVGVKRKATEPTEGSRKSQRLSIKKRRLNSNGNDSPPPRLFEDLIIVDIHKEENKLKFLDALDLIPVPLDRIAHSDDGKREIFTKKSKFTEKKKKMGPVKAVPKRPTDKTMKSESKNKSEGCQLHNPSRSRNSADEQTPDVTWIWRDKLLLDLKKKESAPTQKEINDAVQRLRDIGTIVKKGPTVCQMVHVDVENFNGMVDGSVTVSTFIA